MVSRDPFRSNRCSVAAVEVPDDPLGLDHENLSVLATGLIFSNDDLVGGRTSDRDGSTGHQTKNVRPFFSVPNHEVRDIACGTTFVLIPQDLHLCLIAQTYFEHARTAVDTLDGKEDEKSIIPLQLHYKRERF